MPHDPTTHAAHHLGCALSPHHGPFVDHLACALAPHLRAHRGGVWWKRAEVFEDRLTPTQRGGLLIPMGPAEDYEPSWRRVLERVDRPWVNLRLMGVEAGVLGVLVEFIDSEDPEQPIGPVRVNMGPLGTFLEQARGV